MDYCLKLTLYAYFWLPLRMKIRVQKSGSNSSDVINEYKIRHMLAIPIYLLAETNFLLVSISQVVAGDGWSHVDDWRWDLGVPGARALLLHIQECTAVTYTRSLHITATYIHTRIQ